MNYLEFFASVIGSLAWPSAIVLSVWMFRKEIRPLLPRMRLRHKDTELSFLFEEAAKTVEQLPAPAEEAPLPTQEEVSNFERMARISPHAALMDIRREVEITLRNAAIRSGFRLGGNLGAAQLLRLLRRNSLIDPTAATLFDDIIAIGNIAAHDRQVEFTTEDALRYRELADRAIALTNVPGFMSFGEATTQESQ